jgi:hypothetical protein
VSNLSTFSMLSERVNKYKEDYSLEKSSIAFIWLGLETILNLNADEIEDAITDGAMDGGIDAIHIIDKDVHIFNFTYTELFEHTRKNFPEDEINKILVTMEGIYNKTTQKQDVNDMLWDKICEIWELFKKGSLNFKYYLCSNKQKPVEHAKRKFQTLDKYRFVEYYYIDQEDFVSKILERKYRKVDGEISFIERQYFDRSDGPLKGIVATVAATDLINLVKDPDNPEKIIEDVFNENVRVYLKLKNRINQGIYDTALSDENYEFWYLNNGITIVCEGCSYTPNTRSPKVTLTNLQIVNGGQTTHALFEAYLKNKEKLNNVLVIVRICETKKNYRISEKISETTNSQTPVRTRDLHANDRIQRTLEDEFKSLGYFYERKKNQYINEPPNKRLDNELLGQIYLAYYLDMPSEAKNQKTLVFGDKYDDIFDENTITASTMLLPYRVYLPLELRKKEIQRKKRKKELISERDAFISRATFHLLNSVKIVAEKESLNLEGSKDIEKAIEKVIDYINEVVTKETEKRGDLYTHDKFFKEIPTNKIIRDHITEKYSYNRT